jgi:alpha-beta hydrolase superfamily lysophospholipase
MSLDELRAHAAVRPPITVPAAQLPYRIPAGSLGAGLNRLVVETSGQPVILLAPALEAGMPGRHIIRPQSVHQGLAEFIVDLSVDAPMDGWSIESPGNY